METSQAQIKLSEFVVGSRLVVRSRTDWRFASVAKIDEGRVTITVCSPTGRTYRLRRDVDCEIYMEGFVPIVTCDEPDDWRENLGRYDVRW